MRFLPVYTNRPDPLRTAFLNMQDRPTARRPDMNDRIVSVKAAVERMQLWATDHPETDTPGLFEDEWYALAQAALGPYTVMGIEVVIDPTLREGEARLGDVRIA